MLRQNENIWGEDLDGDGDEDWFDDGLVHEGFKALHDDPGTPMFTSGDLVVIATLAGMVVLPVVVMVLCNLVSRIGGGG